jgi:hypothetical protein
MKGKIRNKLDFIGDGERLFKQWVSWGNAGTVKKLALWAGNELQLKNPRTGKIPSAMGVWAKMWRWALRHPDEARVLYEDYAIALDAADPLTDDEWYSLLHSRAKSLLTSAGYFKYLKKYPHVANYPD